MGSLGVGDTVTIDRCFGANLDLVRVELFERNGVEIVALLGVV